MKPKYSAFRKLALPAVIVLPAIAPIAYSAIVSPDTFGNVIVESGTNAADTILASGGTDLTPTVLIEAGATLTGDVGLQNAIRVTAPNYTINNSGDISGNLDGIFVNAASSGTITIQNNSGAFIEGGTSAIFLEGNGGSVFNLGTITGEFGGIRTGMNAQITNAGTILGNQGDGITLGPDGEIFNSGTIQGSTGIYAENGSYVVNSGTIRSTVAGGAAFLAGASLPNGIDDELVGIDGELNIKPSEILLMGTNDLVLNLGSLILGNVVGAGELDTITFNGGLTSPSGISNVIRGDVTGFGTITKQGSGVAFIGTVNDVNSDLFVMTNTIQINGGGLYINADIEGLTGPLATINANGTALGGTGSWDANVNVNSGGISAGGIPINLDNSPSNAVGRLAIFGDVVHQSDTFIRLDINPDTVINNGVNSDLIKQSGVDNTYTVTGADLRISPTDINRVITPGTYTIIDSDAPIIGFNQFGTVGVQFNDNVSDTGDFIAGGSGPNYLDSVLTNFFVTPGLENGNTNLVVDIDYGFRNLPGLSKNERSIAAALDTLALRAGTGELGLTEQDLIAALALSDLDTVQDSLDAINPESNVDLAIGVINSNYRLHRMVQDRMALARNQPATVTMTTPPPVMDAKGGMLRQSAVVQQSWASRGSVWGSYSYDWQDFEDRDSIRNSDGDTQAFTIGFDYRTSPGFLIGGLVDGSKSDFDLSGGSSDIDSLRFALYGTFGESLGFYSDFLAGYGTHDLEQSGRVGGIGGLAGRRGFSSDADSFQALLTAGFAMGNEQVKHGPFIGLEYQNLDVDSFSSSGGPLVVGVDDYGIDSFRGLVGYRFNGEYGGFRPYLSVAYAHEFKDDYNDATGSIGGVNFDIEGPQLRSAFIVTAGSGIALNQNLMLDVGYRGEIRYESTGISSHGGTIGLTYSF